MCTCLDQMGDKKKKYTLAQYNYWKIAETTGMHVKNSGETNCDKLYVIH